MKLHHIERSVLLPYAVSDMFELVSDVDAYEEFVPWCQKSQVIESTDEYVVGTLQVQYAGLTERIVTKNILKPYKKIEMKLLKGPFSQFSGEWRFLDLGIGSKATLDLSFDVERHLLISLASHFIEKSVEKILHSFVRRAQSQLVECE
ncbi:MAG: type II toxin-antitoxin system RatA family toxin [Gammaproteobacteria bacterium]|nr:type II toxin-antitoxin system RatA family toxin [Gammaproteobacteria bacterium]MYF38336.1 type II toxin-antitoxin system RatA family toxin [Gammaproteobacteria bacterium]